ncbi:TetR/AcrR family transcriptional regulator [Thermoleophilia bacterium SCSIO 60948]|nr:TetR/AcrR family transcriptional regulator [Thermoleophilia bacterium SCSIO 60948]
MAPARTQAERTQASAIALREALAELICEQGYAATTVAQIGERAGYSRAMVRDRYGSKQALLEAFHRDYEELLLGGEGAGTAGSGLDELLGGVDRLVDLAGEHPLALRAIFIVGFESVTASAESRPLILEWLLRFVDEVEAWLRAGIADGSVRPDADVPGELRRFRSDAIGDAFAWVIGAEPDYVARLRAWRAELAGRLAA